MTEAQIGIVVRAVIACSFGLAQVSEGPEDVRTVLRSIVEDDSFWKEIQDEIDRSKSKSN